MSKRSSPLKSVREWLHDYFTMIEDTEMNRILADVACCEVESAIDARNLVNRRIDNWVSWLNGTRPVATDPATWMQPRGSA
jgi:hypothetical protein